MGMVMAVVRVVLGVVRVVMGVGAQVVAAVTVPGATGPATREAEAAMAVAMVCSPGAVARVDYRVASVVIM